MTADPRCLPWQDWREFVEVGTALFAHGAPELQAAALQRVAAWRVRGRVPHRVDATAQLVHTGLLAIGLRAGNPASFYPDFKPATGDSVAIAVRWQDETGDRKAPAQRWVKNSQTGQELDSNWIFAGSIFWKNPKTNIEYYQADGGDLVCVSNFPAATLDLPITSSQANDSLLFEAFTGRVPKRGTPVELVFSHAEQEKPEATN